MKKRILIVVALLATVVLGAILLVGCGNLEADTTRFEQLHDLFESSTMWAVSRPQGAPTAAEAISGTTRIFVVETEVPVWGVPYYGAEPQTFMQTQQVVVRLMNNNGSAAGMVATGGVANTTRHDFIVIQGTLIARARISQELTAIIAGQAGGSGYIDQAFPLPTP